MDYPIKVFEIKGDGGTAHIKLEINEIYGFPDEESFRGGYDICCDLEIVCGNYTARSGNYISSTGALKAFYNELFTCYKSLNGKATYKVHCPENDFEFDVTFSQGSVKVTGKYQDDFVIKNILNFEFYSDQSYFGEVMSDLKKVIILTYNENFNL